MATIDRRWGKRPEGRMEEREPDNLSEVLDDIEQTADAQPEAQPLTLGDLLDSVGRRSYGPLLLLIGLFAISPATALPLMTWATAVLTLVVAGQMAVGLPNIWLPKAARNIRIGRRTVHDSIEKGRPAARWIDHLLRKRLEFLSKPPFVNIVALCVIAAALITFPLGLVPLLPLIPGIAIVAFGLGMTARDGVWLLLGTLIVGGAFWLAVPRLF
ncbi:MAG: polysaccharide synthesis protein exod [Alphaproteobacteria bacterium]|nr:MAG: polysaccharide synthesis protein exod [Alphaproteobacteria bacterium]